jgi:hypothetical protein
MSYFIVYIGSDGKTVKNIVISNHPSEWYQTSNKRLLDNGKTEKVTLIWWIEISKEQAMRFDPNYCEDYGMPYDPIMPGLP